MTDTPTADAEKTPNPGSAGTLLSDDIYKAPKAPGVAPVKA